jgi:hypothetical protein
MRVRRPNSTLSANTDKPLRRKKELARTEPLNRPLSPRVGQPTPDRPRRVEYDYQAFCRAIARLDGPGCFIHRLLVQREHDGADFPLGLLLCEGVIDGHHLIRKNRLKQELSRPFSELVGGYVFEDARNGILACRRHHDLVERGLVVVKAEELPRRVHAFVAEYDLEGWLDRYYRPEADAA